MSIKKNLRLAPPAHFSYGNPEPTRKMPHPCGAPSEPPAPHLRQLMLRRAASRSNPQIFFVRGIFVFAEFFTSKKYILQLPTACHIIDERGFEDCFYMHNIAPFYTWLE